METLDGCPRDSCEAAVDHLCLSSVALPGKSKCIPTRFQHKSKAPSILQIPQADQSIAYSRAPSSASQFKRSSLSKFLLVAPRSRFFQISASLLEGFGGDGEKQLRARQPLRNCLSACESDWLPLIGHHRGHTDLKHPNVQTVNS